LYYDEGVVVRWFSGGQFEPVAISGYTVPKLGKRALGEGHEGSRNFLG
jgi:hypothetical protein